MGGVYEMTYYVCVSRYSLEAGKVGEPIGEPVVVSRHRSLKAAGRMLGSVISGKRSVQYRGYQRFYVLDTESGREIPRVECPK